MIFHSFVGGLIFFTKWTAINLFIFFFVKRKAKENKCMKSCWRGKKILQRFCISWAMNFNCKSIKTFCAVIFPRRCQILRIFYIFADVCCYPFVPPFNCCLFLKRFNDSTWWICKWQTAKYLAVFALISRNYLWL